MGSNLLILSVSAALWPVGLLFLARLRPPRHSAASASSAQTLSIIIPARNEAHNLPSLLRSIQSQPLQPLEILVIDDASSDNTAQIAAQLGATVLPSQPLPENWRGKTWACQQGAQHSRGTLLLFLDADTWLEPSALPRILQLHTSGATSFAPFHIVRKPYEQLSAFFNLIMSLGILRRGLFGQSLLIDRDAYDAAGQHAAVKDRILENVHLASHLAAKNIPTLSLPGKNLLAIRMYPNGLIELIQGWTKGFAGGAAHVPKTTLLLIIAWLTAMCLPLSLFASPWAALLYTLYALQLALLLRRVGNFQLYVALLYPIPLLFYFLLFARSLLRSGRNVSWKGRTIRAA